MQQTLAFCRHLEHTGSTQFSKATLKCISDAHIKIQSLLLITLDIPSRQLDEKDSCTNTLGMIPTSERENSKLHGILAYINPLNQVGTCWKPFQHRQSCIETFLVKWLLTATIRIPPWILEVLKFFTLHFISIVKVRNYTTIPWADFNTKMSFLLARASKHYIQIFLECRSLCSQDWIIFAIYTTKIPPTVLR